MAVFNNRSSQQVDDIDTVLVYAAAIFRLLSAVWLDEAYTDNLV